MPDTFADGVALPQTDLAVVFICLCLVLCVVAMMMAK